MADYKLHVYPVDSSAQVIRKNANESDSGATAFTFVAADFIKIKNTGNMRLFIEIGATSTSVKVFTSLKVDGLYDVADLEIAASTNTLHVLNNLDPDTFNEDEDAGALRSHSGTGAEDGYVAIQLSQATGVSVWATL